MPSANKKINSQELIEKKNQWEGLKKTILPIYLARTKEELFSIIKKDLPELCSVHSIELDHLPKPKKSKNTYTYLFSYQSKDHFIHFYKEETILSKEKKILKKIGQALESALIRMEQQEQLHFQKEQWELAFNTITTPICLTDLEGNIIRTNKNFREKTNLSKINTLQKNYFTVFFGKPDNQPFLNQSKRREKLSKNGKEEIFEISKQLIPQNIGREIQLIIIRNITEQIKLEHKIAQLAKSAELGIISSSIAHELNNPIAGVLALIQTLQIKKTNPNLSKDLNDMSSAIQRCSCIIDQLLNIHR